jgi:hypothetical protein
MILCCDLPRGKFPYLVFNLVVFGHLVSSCVTQATLETRVLPFSCILQFAPDSASFALSFALDVPSRSIPFLPKLPSLFPMSTQSPPLTRKSTTGSSQGVHLSPLYHIEWIDGTHGNVCVPRVSGSNFTLSCFPAVGVRLGLYAPIATFFFSNLFWSYYFS